MKNNSINSKITDTQTDALKVKSGAKTNKPAETKEVDTNLKTKTKSKSKTSEFTDKIKHTDKKSTSNSKRLSSKTPSAKTSINASYKIVKDAESALSGDDHVAAKINEKEAYKHSARDFDTDLPAKEKRPNYTKKSGVQEFINVLLNKSASETSGSHVLILLGNVEFLDAHRESLEPNSAAQILISYIEFLKVFTTNTNILLDIPGSVPLRTVQKSEIRNQFASFLEVVAWRAVDKESFSKEFSEREKAFHDATRSLPMLGGRPITDALVLSRIFPTITKPSSLIKKLIKEKDLILKNLVEGFKKNSSQ